MTRDNRPIWDDAHACIVAIAAFFTTLLTVGFSFSLGIYYVVFLEVFHGGAAETAWISSLNFATLCAIGPIGSLLIARYGCRITMVIGSLLSTIGIIITSIATHLHLVLFSLGLLTGAGLGLAFISSVVVVSLHFKKYRTIAMGFSFSGAGIGCMVFPWLFHALLATYGWRGSLIISAGINLHLCTFAMLLHPQDNFQGYFKPQKMQPPKYKLQQYNLEDKKVSEKLIIESHKSISDSLVTFKSIEDSALAPEEPIWKIFVQWQYCMLHINCVLFCFGMTVVYTHLSSYARNLRMIQTQSSMLLSATGFSNLLGRFGLGALGQLPYVDVMVLFIASYIIAGVAVIGIGLSSNFIIILISAILFGFFSAGFGPLLSETTCSVVGVEKYNYAYGFMMVSQGLGGLMGGPSAGLLYDVFQNYKYSFFMGGAFIILSAISIVFIKLAIKKVGQFVSQHEISVI